MEQVKATSSNSRGAIDPFEIFLQYAQLGFDSNKTVAVNRRKGADWVARRCCTNDWILAVYASRWNRVKYEVGIFLAEDHVDYQRFSGVKAGLMFLLSDAYFQTGKMELTFCGPRNGRPSLQTGHEPGIPHSIRALAADLGVLIEDSVEEFQNVRKTKLSDKSGRALYARVTGFSSRVVDILNRPESSVDLTRACFITQRGVWIPEQVEYLACEAINPSRLLEGGILPESRLSFQHDLMVLRTALAWERAKTILEKLSGVEEVIVSPMKWHRDVAEILVEDDLCVPASGGTTVRIKTIRLKKGTTVILLLLPRAKHEYVSMEVADVATIKSKRPTFVVVSSDYAESKANAALGLETAGSPILTLLDSVADLDAEAYRRLARSASTRREMPEHPE